MHLCTRMTLTDHIFPWVTLSGFTSPQRKRWQSAHVYRCCSLFYSTCKHTGSASSQTLIISSNGMYTVLTLCNFLNVFQWICLPVSHFHYTLALVHHRLSFGHLFFLESKHLSEILTSAVSLHHKNKGLRSQSHFYMYCGITITCNVFVFVYLCISSRSMPVQPVTKLLEALTAEYRLWENSV